MEKILSKIVKTLVVAVLIGTIFCEDSLAQRNNIFDDGTRIARQIFKYRNQIKLIEALKNSNLKSVLDKADLKEIYLRLDEESKKRIDKLDKEKKGYKKLIKQLNNLIKPLTKQLGKYISLAEKELIVLDKKVVAYYKAYVITSFKLWRFNMLKKTTEWLKEREKFREPEDKSLDNLKIQMIERLYPFLCFKGQSKCY